MRNYHNVIVQLARLGDLVQTLPLVQSLRSRYGDGSTALVVDEKLANIAEMMLGSEHVIKIPVNSMLQASLKPSLGHPWRLAKKVVKQLSTINAKRVINLNYHRPAAVVAEAIPSLNWVGARWIDIMNKGATDELLIELFQANIGIRQGRRHLSDIWRDYAGYELRMDISGRDQEAGTESWRPMLPSLESIGLASSLLSKVGLQQSDAPVAIIPGSGHELRRWSEDNWVKLSREISQFAPVILIGTESESEIADRVIAGVEGAPGLFPVKSICGMTDLKSLTGTLSMCRLAAGVDTGTLHLAAATGTPCLGIFFGSMHFRETGPYGSGHVVVTPARSDYPCHESEMEHSGRSYENDISATAVIDVIRSMIEGEIFSPAETHVYISKVSSEALTWISTGQEADNCCWQEKRTYQSVANAI